MMSFIVTIDECYKRQYLARQFYKSNLDNRLK